MKKWLKTSLALGTTAALVVPSAASAATFDEMSKLQDQEKPDVLKELLGSDAEKKILAYKKQQDQKDQLSSDTIVIKYDKSLPKTVHQKAGTSIVKSIPSLGYDVVKVKKGQQLQTALSYYAQVDGVKSAAQSVQYKTSGAVDPKKGQQYHQTLLQIDEALKLAGSHEVTVAVIDSGLDKDHPDLKSQLLSPYNAADPANGAFTDMHGTHIAGIIAASANNGIGGQGVAPNAKILPIDVFNGGWGASDYIIAEGILYAIEKGVDVINMSLGGYMESEIFEDAVQKAIDAGITVVAAAGNEAWDEYSSPASYEGVISVGATNKKNELAEFSNYGPSVDIVAPGDAVYSTVFDYLKGSSFIEASGTSMASPVVAGVVALLKSKYPDLKPVEVEYILEQTAKDLGEEGYDLKFANGLVNPVAALKFDMKSLPKFESLTNEQKLKDAKVLKSDAKDVQNGTFTKPEERHYYKIDLKKGDYLQTVLEGAEMYDYGYELTFISEENSDPIKVNEGKAGETEGYLYQAEENGTLLITVKDANGSYSVKGDSKYTFTAEKLTSVRMDDSSRENIIPIETIPYISKGDENGPFTLYTEDKEGDKDYFSFTVEEPQLLSIDVSGVPGVDSSLAVYFKEDLGMERPPELPEWEMWPYPLQLSNIGGKGQDERLVFEAMPEMEYVLEVSGQPTLDFYYYDPFSPNFYFDSEPGSSSIPYDLNIAGLELPPDEDGGGMMGYPEEKFMDEELTEEEYMEAKKNQFEKGIEKKETNYYRMFDEGWVDMIVGSAPPFEIGKDVKGYFQYTGDEDFYTFTSDSDSIYEFEFESGDNQYLWGTIFEYDEKNHDLIPISDIGYFYGMGQEMKASLALEKDKSYYVQLRDEMGRISADPYIMKSEKIMEAPEEQDTDESKLIRAKIMSVGQAYENYLVKTTDTDIYYYKHRGDEKILNLQLTPQIFTEEQKSKLPKSVQNPLYLYTTIVEDTNGNMNIDAKEAAKSMFFGPSNAISYEVNASFKAKKDIGYFVIANNGSWGTVSVQPYQVKLNNLNTNDEDKDSVVKNNIPSKPLSLKADKGILKATGYFNAGVDFGDKDIYKLNMNQNGTATISLNTEASLDGVIKVFNQAGTLVKEFDYYGVADSEIGTLSLKKGQYYIEVSEAASRVSTKAYELEVLVK